MPRVVGHRGGRGPGWPRENTLAAFARAKEEGAGGIELDVRAAAGGELVVFHDATLARLSSGEDTRSVATVPASELARTFEAPTLDEALAWAAAHDVMVNAELKRDVPDRLAFARRVARALAAAPDVLVSSFDPVILLAMAALAPRVPRALVTHARQRSASGLLAAARRPAVHAVHLERTQTEPRVIEALTERGLRVGVWTVNDPREAKDLVAAGAAYVITDDPASIAAAIGAGE